MVNTCLRLTSSSTSCPARASVSHSFLNKNEKCKHESCAIFPHESNHITYVSYKSKMKINFVGPKLNPKNLRNFSLKILQAQAKLMETMDMVSFRAMIST